MKNLNQLFEYKKVTLPKSQVYTKMKEILVDAGWYEISSKPATEGFIFYSKGESGDKDIYFQIRDFYQNGTANIFSSTTSTYLEFRILLDYVPNTTSGLLGTLTPAISTYNNVLVRTSTKETSIPISAKYELYYLVNKDRVIFVIRTPFINESCFVMIGRPSPHYSLQTEKIGNVIVASMSHTSHLDPAVYLGEVNTTKSTAARLTVWNNTIPRSFMKRSIYMSEVAYGTNTEGLKGYLDGIYTLNNDADKYKHVNDGDIIVDEYGNEFTIFSTAGSATSFEYTLSSPFFAICTKVNKVEEGEE